MPEEKLAEIVSRVDFAAASAIWMPQLESCFREVLRFEYYLDKVPGNLALPRYRKIVISILYRLLCQVPRSRFEFSRSIDQPDPVIGEFLTYLAEAEIRRQMDAVNQYPVTPESIRSLLKTLKHELEL